jgi:hypothetical protein
MGEARRGRCLPPSVAPGHRAASSPAERLRNEIPQRASGTSCRKACPLTPPGRPDRDSAVLPPSRCCVALRLSDVGDRWSGQDRNAFPARVYRETGSGESATPTSTHDSDVNEEGIRLVTSAAGRTEPDCGLGRRRETPENEEAWRAALQSSCIDRHQCSCSRTPRFGSPDDCLS